MIEVSSAGITSLLVTNVGAMLSTGGTIIAAIMDMAKLPLYDFAQSNGGTYLDARSFMVIESPACSRTSIPCEQMHPVSRLYEQ